jgi:nicotinate phosphoribosyltransferase
MAGALPTDLYELTMATSYLCRGMTGPASGIRLDSGDLGPLAVQSRAILDNAGLPQVRITASGGLDEYALDDLARAGAPIDGYGVGTKTGDAADAPYLDTAYKLVQFGERPVFKLSPGKATSRSQAGVPSGLVDQVGLRDQTPPGTAPLLRQVMSAGRRAERPEPLSRARQRCAANLAQLNDEQRRLRDPSPRTAGYTVELQQHARDTEPWRRST